MVRVEHLQVGHQRLITPRLAGLALQRADLALHLFDDVADAEEVGFGRLELAHRLLLLALVFRDAGGFFENGAPIFRARAEDEVDLALLHDGVGAAADAGIGEEALDVAQAADGLVQEIFRIAVAEDAARDAHFVPVDAELLRAIGEGERNFGEADAACGESVPLKMTSAISPPRSALADCSPRTQRTASRTFDLPQPFGPTTAVTPSWKFEDGFVGKRLKADELERLEVHAGKAASPLEVAYRNGRRLTSAFPTTKWAWSRAGSTIYSGGAIRLIRRYRSGFAPEEVEDRADAR